MCNTPGFRFPPNIQFQQHPSSRTSSNMNSNVGNAQVYEAGDQRNPKQSEIETPDRYNEGQAHAHSNMDSKDERSIKNRLAAAEAADDSHQDSRETQLHKKDPTLPAKDHGNEPSRGAKIDAEIQAEEEEILKKKGASLPGQKW
ncbi:hypothetical protein GE21DRAFT_781 [Neurospora crassa]|uniref:Uncharacterized protein n=2 Tax=Neurospora TaxID=5140 RepID=Q7SG24_NEUCR|nr:hypothetical protein NCU02596 [Neurospora crassa OR74A]EAA35763.2 hypothetical protein NCU02596 [Neurospora crassa OR74A]KHE90033.1 hypothetical protein GE21DRAFT_781 [Neurospora crassa]|eukprot:XP_964999.2 hypothetical protein NCU02596 [Neurospora crassa OR74A]